MTVLNTLETVAAIALKKNPIATLTAVSAAIVGTIGFLGALAYSEYKDYGVKDSGKDHTTLAREAFWTGTQFTSFASILAFGFSQYITGGDKLTAGFVGLATAASVAHTYRNSKKEEFAQSLLNDQTTVKSLAFTTFAGIALASIATAAGSYAQSR
jgi:hypothetical protein